MRCRSTGWTTWLTSSVAVFWGVTWTVAGSTSRPDGEAPDLGGERRREEQGLAARRHEVDDPADVADEAHVEHAIGLVEDEDLDVRQVDRALVGVVEEAARRRDDDRRAGAERANLRIEADAAVDRGRADAAVGAVRPDALLDLEGELAGRGRGRGRGSAGGSRRGDRATWAGHDRLAVREALEDRQHERGGLAGAGLGAGEEVAAGEDDGDRLALDGRGLRVALVGHGTEQFGRQPERIEGHGSISS